MRFVASAPLATRVVGAPAIGFFVSSKARTLRSPGGGLFQGMPGAAPHVDASPLSTNAMRFPSGDHAGWVMALPVRPLVATGWPSTVVKRPTNWLVLSVSSVRPCAIAFVRMNLPVGERVALLQRTTDDELVPFGLPHVPPSE